MQINKASKYRLELKQILFYIAKDKISAMLDFRKKLNESLNLLKVFPYKNQRSIYFENENIRDMTFNQNKPSSST